MQTRNKVKREIKGRKKIGERKEQKKKIKIFWIFHPFHLPGEVVLPNIFLPSEARAKKNYFTREVVWPQTEVLLNTPLE